MSEPVRAQPDVVAQVQEVLLTWVYPQRKMIADLVKAGALTGDEVRRTLSRLTEAAAHTLGVERASVWHLRDDGSAIECVDLYERSSGRRSTGAVIAREAAPGYFRALASERVIAAHDAREDPRTSELRDGYLSPLGITSMLDAPAFVRGRARAVLCHEHVGPTRRWQFWEELVASTFADFVALVLEAETQSRDVARWRADHERLEQQVAERTAALRESEQNLQALIDAVPVSVVLTRASDHRVVYGNARAFAMFETTPEEAYGRSAADFWVDPAERQSFLTTLLSNGRVDDLEVRMRSRTGRLFWVRMNAKAIRYHGELTLLGGMVDVTEQRQAQQNLRQIFESAPVMMVVSRLSDDALLYGNQRATSIFELNVAEGRGRPADLWVDPADRDRLRQRVVAEGRVDGFEAELKTASGRRFWAELAAGVIEFDGTPALLAGGTDISARKRADAALRKSEQTLRTLLDAAPNPLVVTGLDDGVVRYCNPPAGAMFELHVDQFVGRRAPDFYVDPEERVAFIEELRHTGEVRGFTARLRTSTGRAFWALMNANTVELDGEAAFFVGFAELTAQKELEERLRTLAITDELTGTFNRRHFLELGANELKRAERHGHATSLAMLDLDHFKAINDRFGHPAGDEALRAVAAVLRREVRGADVLGRIGGEEFALLLPETQIAQAEAMVERIRRLLSERPYEGGGLPAGQRITVSIGLAEQRPGETIGELLRRADAALYRAKAAGRNRVMTDRQPPDPTPPIAVPPTRS